MFSPDVLKHTLECLVVQDNRRQVRQTGMNRPANSGLADVVDSSDRSSNSKPDAPTRRGFQTTSAVDHLGWRGKTQTEVPLSLLTSAIVEDMASREDGIFPRDCSHRDATTIRHEAVAIRSAAREAYRRLLKAIGPGHSGKKMVLREPDLAASPATFSLLGSPGPQNL